MARVTGSYDSILKANAAQYDKVIAGYGQLLSGIEGIGASERQNITDQYTAEGGKQTQGLINRGLGNTTVANSIQRGLQLDQAKAQGSLAEKIAGLRAGYEGQKLDFMGRQVRDPYPYLSLEMQQRSSRGGGGGGGGQVDMSGFGRGGFGQGGGPTFTYGRSPSGMSGYGAGAGGYDAYGAWAGTSSGTGSGNFGGYGFAQTEEPPLAGAGDWLTQGGLAAGDAAAGYDFAGTDATGNAAWGMDENWWGGGSEGWF